MKKYKFCIVGGDLRSVYLARALAAEHQVLTLGLENSDLPESLKAESLSVLKTADAVILPLPCTDSEGNVKAAFGEDKIAITDVIANMSTGSVLMGGLVPQAVLNAAKEKGIEVYDYYNREEFAVRNAALTAEAAAALAMEMLSESLSGVPVLILGHGRIGRLLSAILKALDAKVTVAARRYSELAWIRSEGMQPLEFHLLDEKIGGYKIIFNTVPSLVLTAERLMLMDREAFIIDLASEPCGTDFEAAKALGITAKKALGLPGKFAPKTAGEILRDTVLNILAERGEE